MHVTIKNTYAPIRVQGRIQAVQACNRDFAHTSHGAVPMGAISENCFLYQALAVLTGHHPDLQYQPQQHIRVLHTAEFYIPQQSRIRGGGLPKMDQKHAAAPIRPIRPAASQADTEQLNHNERHH